MQDVAMRLTQEEAGFWLKIIQLYLDSPFLASILIAWVVVWVGSFVLALTQKKSFLEAFLGNYLFSAIKKKVSKKQNEDKEKGGK